MGSKSYTQNAKSWTTKLRKGNMPSIQDARTIETTSKSIIR